MDGILLTYFLMVYLWPDLTAGQLKKQDKIASHSKKQDWKMQHIAAIESEKSKRISGGALSENLSK